jgi:hypothetical protein
VGLASADVFKAGADRLMVTQNSDGGWDWPLWDFNPKLSNDPEILAPTAMGLAQTYRLTSDPNCLAALKKAGTYLLNKTPQQITPEDGYFAVALDGILGGTTYTDFVKKNFYEPLAKGTYLYLGPDFPAMKVDTERYVWILWQEVGGEAPNLAALDCGFGLYAAHLVGADTKPWIDATKLRINCLIAGDGYDVLGLAGAVLGLASVKENIDPTTGSYASAGSLADLASILVSYQLSTGGFTWNSLCTKEDAGNEAVEETAIALLALNEVDGSRYLAPITKAADFLRKAQLPTGGWENYFGQGEFNQLTGEALWAIGAAQEVQAKQPKAGSAVPTP